MSSSYFDNVIVVVETAGHVGSGSDELLNGCERKEIANGEDRLSTPKKKTLRDCAVTIYFFFFSPPLFLCSRQGDESMMRCWFLFQSSFLYLLKTRRGNVLMPLVPVNGIGDTKERVWHSNIGVG